MPGCLVDVFHRRKLQRPAKLVIPKDHRQLSLSALQTPPRPQEYWFETLAILFLATGIVFATLWIFRRLRFLEDFIRICAWCRKVEVADQWVTSEDYMKQQYDVKSTHGICPACRTSATKRPAAALAHVSA